jgi:hypothetical protein
MGSVTDIVKRYVPASYRALISVTNSYYGMTELQALADTIQFRLFSTVVGVTGEASSYTRTELDLLGTLTTLHFIPAAVDYWGDQLQTQATSGTNEDVSYFDRRPELWKVYDKLAEHAIDLGEETGVAIKKLKASTPAVTYGDNGRGILVTPDPALFPSSYDNGRYTYTTPWDYPD